MFDHFAGGVYHVRVGGMNQTSQQGRTGTATTTGTVLTRIESGIAMVVIIAALARAAVAVVVATTTEQQFAAQ